MQLTGFWKEAFGVVSTVIEYLNNPWPYLLLLYNWFHQSPLNEDINPPNLLTVGQ